MVKDWINKMYGGDIEARERLFRIVISMGIAADIIAVICEVIFRQTIMTILPLAAGGIIMFLCLKWSCHTHKIEIPASIIQVMVNFLLFPLAFFISGGVNGGVAIWFVLGIFFIFLLFSGRKFYVFLSLTILEFILAYYVSYRHPEWVIPLGGQSSVYIDSALSMIIVSIVIGGIIRFQNKVYIQERIRSEKQRDEIEQMSKSKSAFFANMSHEIRTPINTIIGLNEMTLREDISDEVAENSIHIQDASKMLLALINDVLDLSKIESGKMEVVNNQYETGAMFSDLVNIIWIRAQEKDLKFKVNISSEIPSMLYGDEVRIKQVLTNLLTNAVKYTKAGSVTLSAQSERLSQNTVRLRIAVEDTGIGIKKEDLDSLFKSFKRVDEVQNHKIEGTGLGLSISRQLIEMMGGTITVDSIYKKGSTFTVIIDQQIVDENPVGNMEFMIKRKVHNREKYKQRFEAPEARILIVDDNEMNRMVACKLLRSTKIQIDTAKNGRECLDKTRNKFYHIIFMDHMMPEMDGVETLKKLRRQENGLCRKVPVIALTANAMAGATDFYKKKGFQGYLAKPVNGALFEATLLKYLPEELIQYNEEISGEQEAADTVKMISGRQKKSICITTDCVCDLPREWMKRFDIRTMYYYVYTSEGRFCDGKEITSDNLLAYLSREGAKAHSSHASVEEYENFFADALGEAERVIHISIASRASTGYDTAVSAARGFDNVYVVDSGHLSNGMGIMVLYAAQMAQEGYRVEDILQALKNLRGLISTSFIVPSADTLYQNGKISASVKKICDGLGCHPVLQLSQSRIRLLRMETGKITSAYRKYIRHQLGGSNKIDRKILFITYAGCSVKQQEEILAEVSKYRSFEHVIVQKASATISSNCGLGAFGLMYMKEK